MLLTKMDLLNYQYLDKMNNNIGILCYEGKHTLCCYAAVVSDCGAAATPRITLVHGADVAQSFTPWTFSKYQSLECEVSHPNHV